MGKQFKKSYMLKCIGGNYVVRTHACSKISFGSLQRNTDYNFCLEFLILPSSGRLKQTCDTCTQLRLALETEEERKAKKKEWIWFGFGLELIGIEIGVLKNKKFSWNKLARPVCEPFF